MPQNSCAIKVSRYSRKTSRIFRKDLNQELPVSILWGMLSWFLHRQCLDQPLWFIPREAEAGRQAFSANGAALNQVSYSPRLMVLRRRPSMRSGDLGSIPT